MFTSINEGHRHKWDKNKKFTSFNSGHKHKIDLRKRLALANRKGGHTHKLLNG